MALKVEGHFTIFLNTGALHSPFTTTVFPASVPWSCKTQPVRDFDNLPHDLPLPQPFTISIGSVKDQHNFLFSYTITGNLLRKDLLTNWDIKIHVLHEGLLQIPNSSHLCLCPFILPLQVPLAIHPSTHSIKDLSQLLDKILSFGQKISNTYISLIRTHSNLHVF